MRANRQFSTLFAFLALSLSPASTFLVYSRVAIAAIAQDKDSVPKDKLTFKMPSTADSLPSQGRVQLTVHQYLASNGQYLTVAYYFFPSLSKAHDAFTAIIRDADTVLEYRPAAKDLMERALLLNKIKAKDEERPGACFLTIDKATLRNICSESLDVTLAFISPHFPVEGAPSVVPYGCPMRPSPVLMSSLHPCPPA